MMLETKGAGKDMEKVLAGRWIGRGWTMALFSEIPLIQTSANRNRFSADYDAENDGFPPTEE